MKNRDCKIAFLTSFDPMDRRAWSGSIYYIASAVKKHIGSVDFFGPVTIPFIKLRKKAADLKFKITGKRSYPGRSLSASKYYGSVFEKKLTRKKYDYIIAPAASVELANLKTEIPIIYISDATFSLIKDEYTIFSSLSKKTLKDQEEFEKKAISSSSLCVYPSDWAAHSAIEDYGTKKDKVVVINFGANLDKTPEFNDVTEKKIDGTLKMLFLAKEWERKGGDTAFETLLALDFMGIDAELTVLGVSPPKNIRHEKLRVVPYLNKNNRDEREEFNKILHESNLLLLPTKKECYGIVLCEANSYGLPVFTTDTGGISSIVKNGINGFLLPQNATGTDFATLIIKEVLKGDYSKLNMNSRLSFENRLNWDHFGIDLKKYLNKIR